MEQLLPRGFEIPNSSKIKRMLTGTADWQIYVTSTDAYVLAASFALHDKWVQNGFLPDGVFLPAAYFSGCRIFAGRVDALISSLEHGPFPTNAAQIEAFSISFGTAMRPFGVPNLHTAIYIEEHSLLLPTDFAPSDFDAKLAYGKWITGGAGVSVDSLPRIKELLSWLAPDLLEKSIALAGFNKEKASAAPSPKTPFSLVGRVELEKFFQENILNIVLNAEAYSRMGIPFPGATVLHGPPGCGKTYAVNALAAYLGWRRFDIDASSVASPYIHETSKKIAAVFDAAIEAAPSVLVIDEMEAFLQHRVPGAGGNLHHAEEVAEFLRRIPIAAEKGVLVFGMTNMLSSIDAAALRKGRFDHIVEVTPANEAEIEALLIAKCKALPVLETVNFHKIAATLAGHPLSDVAFLLREAGKAAVRKKSAFMDSDCFAEALRFLPETEVRTPIGFIA